MAADGFRLAWGAGFALFGLAFASSAVAEKPARLQPTRIASIGDSITRAFDSNLILVMPSSIFLILWRTHHKFTRWDQCELHPDGVGYSGHYR